MKLLKISSISLFVLFSLILTTGVSAVETTPVQKKPVVLATVNIQDAKIVSRENNVLNIFFKITNREGAQSGIKYSVNLIQKTGKTQTTADEYIYPEVISVGANSVLEKNITYIAPANMNGTYTVVILAKNYSGLPLGITSLGEIELVSTIKTAEILPETCFTSTSADKNVSSTPINKGINISSKENILLTCTVVNNSKESVSAVPTYETHYRSLYGDVAGQQGGDVNPISLKAGEKKPISLNLPKATIPQVYSVKVSLKSGEVYSNSVVVNYNLSGLSATIQNFSLDKGSYKTNETANLSFFWTASSGKKEALPPITLEAKITDARQKECIVPVNQLLASVGLVQIPAQVIKNCDNPQVAIALKDASGNTLDQKQLSFEPTEKPSTNIFAGKNGIIVTIIAILVLLGVAIYFMKLKKKENKTGDDSDKTSGNIGGSTLAVFFFIFMFGLALIPGGSAKAYTAYVSACDMQEPPYNCGDYYSIFNFNLDKSTYTPGEPIVLNASVENNGGLSIMGIYALPEWGDTQQELFRYSDFDSAYFDAPAYSSNIIIDGDYSYSGYLCCGPTYTSFPWSFQVTVSAPVAPPAAPTVTVYANGNTPSTTINYNQGATISWKTDPVTLCSSCTYTNSLNPNGVACPTPGFSGQAQGEFLLTGLTSDTVINIVCGNTTGGTSSSCVGTVAGSMINGETPGPYEGESCSQFTTQGDCLQGWLTHSCSWR